MFCSGVDITSTATPILGLDGRSNYRTFWCFGVHSTPLIIRISILFTFHMVESKSQSLICDALDNFFGLPSISRRFLSMYMRKGTWDDGSSMSNLS